ncbi:type II toxin-antitoxin system VapC family toxin, partial [Moraxella equi]
MASYLLDTHTLLWWWVCPSSLSANARAQIANKDNQIFISLINLWELGIKYQKGKLPIAQKAVEWFEILAKEDGFVILSTKLIHARTASSYQQAHSDPFDRMLVAQAECERLILSRPYQT